MRKMILALSCAAALGTAGSAGAATSFFNDFESGAYVGSGFVVLPAYEGWTASFGPGIEVQYGNVAGLAYSGKHLVELDSHSNSNMSRSIDAGSYTLTFQYSDRPSTLAGSNGIDVLLNGFSILSVAGGNGAAGTVWTQKSVNFVAGAGPNVLTFAALGTSDSLGGYLDDIALSAVPEPASWAMMMIGLGVVGTAMRRNRKVNVQFA